MSEAAPQPTPEPAAETAPEPAARPTAALAADAVPAPAAETAPEPAADAVPRPAAETAPEPAADAAAEPGEQPAPESGALVEVPERQPRPDADAFAQTIDRFLTGDAATRDREGPTIREMAAALEEAHALDTLADAVERLALHQEGDPGDETCLGLARSLVSPAVASRIAGRLAAEREESRRAVLLKACQRIGHEMGIAIADALSSEATDRHARRALVEALVALGQTGMSVVEQMMEDSRWFVVRNGVAVLGEVGGDRAVELITTSLAHPHPRVRREALLSLARVGGEDAGMFVSGTIEDSDPGVRAAAAMAAGELKLERTVKPLLNLVEGESQEEVVIAALRALGQIGDPGAVNTIQKRAVRSLLSRPPTNVRIVAYRALHKIGTPHAKRLLEAATDDKDPEVKAAVRELMESRDQDPVPESS